MFEGLQTQIKALFWNIISWLLSFLNKDSSNILNLSIPSITKNYIICRQDACISIHSPGGLEELQLTLLNANGSNGNKITTINDTYATVGYNVPQYPPPYVNTSSISKLINNDLKELDLVVVKVSYFSVNYADVCIRWGLYESAARYVGESSDLF